MEKKGKKEEKSEEKKEENMRNINIISIKEQVLRVYIKGEGGKGENGGMK